MKIFINDMLASAKQHFVYNYQFEGKSCEMEGRKVLFNEPPELLCKITRRDNDELYADIDVHLDTILNCVRCLDEMKITDDIKISGKLSKQDMDIDYDIILVDDYLDLEKIFFDSIFEHLHDHLFCKLDCRGLCHICGINLNHFKCNCEQENPNIDPRLAELKNFF